MRLCRGLRRLGLLVVFFPILLLGSGFCLGFVKFFFLRFEEGKLGFVLGPAIGISFAASQCVAQARAGTREVAAKYEAQCHGFLHGPELVAELERQHRRRCGAGQQHRGHAALSGRFHGRVAGNKPVAELRSRRDRRHRPSDTQVTVHIEETRNDYGIGEALLLGIRRRADVVADGTDRFVVDQNGAVGDRFAIAREYPGGANDLGMAGLGPVGPFAIDEDGAHAGVQGERLAGEDDEIGVLAGGQRTDAIRHAQQRRGIGRQHTQCVDQSDVRGEQAAQVEQILQVIVVCRLKRDAEAGRAQIAGGLGRRVRRRVAVRLPWPDAGREHHAADVCLPSFQLVFRDRRLNEEQMQIKFLGQAQCRLKIGSARRRDANRKGMQFVLGLEDRSQPRDRTR